MTIHQLLCIEHYTENPFIQHFGCEVEKNEMV